MAMPYTHGAEAPTRRFNSRAGSSHAHLETLPPLDTHLAQGESIESVFLERDANRVDVTRFMASGFGGMSPRDIVADGDRQVRDGSAKNISRTVRRVVLATLGGFAVLIIVVKFVAPLFL